MTLVDRRLLHPADSAGVRCTVGLGLLASVVALLFAGGCSSTAVPTASGASLTCGSGPAFSEAELRGIGSDPRDDALGAALATFLSGPEAARAGFSRTNWTRVVASETSALFLSPAVGPSAPYGFVVLTNINQRWTPEAFGGCLPRRQAAGAISVSWALLSPPAATNLEVLAETESCGPDRASLTSEVVYGETDVVVTIWSTGQVESDVVLGCVGESRALQVELEQPLAGRSVTDGGVVPARLVHVVGRPVDGEDASPGPDPSIGAP